MYISDSEEEEEKPTGFFAKMSLSLNSFKEGNQLKEKDLQVIMEEFKSQLISKNVSEEAARLICKNLSQKIKDEKFTFFSSPRKIIKKELEKSLNQILTPKKNIDLLS